MPASSEQLPAHLACTENALVISVVSHGHGASVQRLLDQIAQYSVDVVARVVLTINAPQPDPTPPPGGWPFIFKVRRNARPGGFSANHNRALASGAERFVCILNPDVALCDADPFAALVLAASLSGVGCAYPAQVDEQGREQDSERALPTPTALVKRRLLGRTESQVDWVNAACLVLRREVWNEIGGFDTRYFMYCEDVDLCLRLRLRGLSLARADSRILHSGQRASRRQWRALGWHIQSLLRLWGSAAYRDARDLLPLESIRAGSIGS